jgi:hypothetical protein
MPLGDIVAEGLGRIFVEILFEGAAYFTGFLILFPFTFGRVKEKFSDNAISLAGLTFWVLCIALICWQPWESGEPV